MAAMPTVVTALAASPLLMSRTNRTLSRLCNSTTPRRCMRTKAGSPRTTPRYFSWTKATRWAHAPDLSSQPHVVFY
eukprot:580548-Pleurochrysis_carterae.AAC.3